MTQKDILYPVDTQSFVDTRQQKIKDFLTIKPENRKLSDYAVIDFNQAYLNGYRHILTLAESSFLKENDSALLDYEAMKHDTGSLLNTVPLSEKEKKSLQDPHIQSYLDFAINTGAHTPAHIMPNLPEKEKRPVSCMVYLDTPSIEMREISPIENKKINTHQDTLHKCTNQRYAVLQNVYAFCHSSVVLLEKNIPSFNSDRRQQQAFKAVLKFQELETKNRHGAQTLRQNNFAQSIQPLEHQFLGEAAAYNDMLTVLQKSPDWEKMTEQEAQKELKNGNTSKAHAWRSWKSGAAPTELMPTQSQSTEQEAIISQKAHWLSKNKDYANQMEQSFTIALNGMNSVHYTRMKNKDAKWVEQNVDIENKEEAADTILFKEDIVQNNTNTSLPHTLRDNSLPLRQQHTSDPVNIFLDKTTKQIG